MATTTRLVAADADDVFAVLADGWTYSDWVVGTAHIRAVDDRWPQQGSHLHHKAGPWPVSLKDSSTVLECEPGRMLLLKVRLWPFGAGEVRLDLAPVSPGRTRVTMKEQFTQGALLGARNKLHDVLLHYRNREALRRLADIVEGRRRSNGGGPDSR